MGPQRAGSDECADERQFREEEPTVGAQAKTLRQGESSASLSLEHTLGVRTDQRGVDPRLP